MTDNAKLPLSAAQGKALMDLYTKLNIDLTKQYALAGATFITDFNNAASPGRYRVYNASGTAAHGPYAGSVGGYVDILTDGDTNVTGTKVYQRLHDHNGDTYVRINISGTSYGAWEHHIQDSDLARFKTNDFVISKDVAVMALQVNGDTYAKIMKNAVNGKADYGTCIIDYTNGAKTEIKIQNGKMLIDGKEVATK